MSARKGENMEERYLYKAKRLDNGEWVQGALIYDDRDGLYRIITEISYSTGTCLTTDNAPRVNSSTICQCTGLKDKNGKLIWENDIMKYQWDGKTKIDVVKYESPMFSYKNVIRWSLYQDEVIGNIFDNPELLESEE